MPSHEKNVIFFAVLPVATKPNTREKSRYPNQIPIQESESVRCIFLRNHDSLSKGFWFSYINQE
ncbi:MAG: hypothetical protein IPI97_08810 [Nitrosomonas sp.]|nr:hypothetical protein [Nitrosomonas sp.]